MPKNAQAVATLRKSLVVLWVPAPAKGQGKKAAARITKIAQLAGHRVGVIGRTEANVNVLKLILKQYGVDPAKVAILQFPASEAVDAIRGQKADAYLATGPISGRATMDAIAASTHDGKTPTFLAIDWPRRSHKTIRCTKRRISPPAPLAARPTGRTTR